MQLERHLTTDELRQHIRMAKDPRIAIRFNAIYLAQSGHSISDIAKITGYGRRTIQLWIRRYNLYGPKGLKDKTGRGRKNCLTKEQMQWLRHKITSCLQGNHPLHADDIRRIIFEQFHITFSIRHTQKILRSLGGRFRYVYLARSCRKNKRRKSWIIKTRSIDNTGN